MATETATTWKVKGTVVLACNCDYGCPCNFMGRPTTGDCEGGWTWHVEDGSFGDVDLAGLNFSLIGDWPAAIHEGNGEALLLVDERADDEQRAALERLLSGEGGGPWGILKNTISTVHGPHAVAYEIALDGIRSRVRGGDKLELELEPVKNPISGAELHSRAVLPEGFVFQDGELAASTSYWVRDGVSYDHSGKYAAIAPFEYTGP